MRAAVAISISLLATAGVGTAAAQCTKASVGAPARALPSSGRPQGLSLGFDGSVSRDDNARPTEPRVPGSTDPTGHWVAVGQSGVGLVVQSGSVQKTLTAQPDMSWNWRPDGGAIAFGQDEAIGVHLQIAEVATGFAVRPVDALLCPAGSPIWSPDGGAIAVVSPADGMPCAAGERLVVLDPQSGRKISQAPISTTLFTAGGWSADGHYAEAGGLLNVRTGVTLLPASAADRPRTIADCAFIGWAPVGSRFAASCNGRLALIDASTGARTTFSTSTKQLDAPIAWSSDGSRFAVSTARGFVLARSSGAARVIPFNGCAGGFVIGFAKNGRVLAQAFNHDAGA
jgi:hypothetical protein